VVLDAFAQAFADGPQRCLVIGSALFGEDEYAAALRERATRLGISDQVVFSGFRDDVEVEIDALHVLVHASTIPEPFGQVIVEGMAAGRPVVATDHGGPAEIISHDRNGLLYPAGDVRTLSAILQHLNGDPALRQRLGAAALVRARDFDPDVVGPHVADLYKSVVRNG
jgi:glycosyltransferase involved in cell wall biosynthesis